VLAFRSAPARITVLAGHLLNSLVRNIEIRRGAFGLAIPAKIQQSGRLQWAFACIFNASR
jgi:hypothetical protein